MSGLPSKTSSSSLLVSPVFTPDAQAVNDPRFDSQPAENVTGLAMNPSCWSFKLRVALGV